MKRALLICIKAARGKSIEEDEDFMKELKILERQKKQNIAAEESKLRLCADEVGNVLEFVFFPVVEGLEKAMHAVDDVFGFSQIQWYYLLSKTKEIDLTIDKKFYITFFDDHYFADGILNKNFPYGKYPTEEDKRQIVSQFKQYILNELKEKL